MRDTEGQQSGSTSDVPATEFAADSSSVTTTTPQPPNSDVPPLPPPETPAGVQISLTTPAPPLPEAIVASERVTAVSPAEVVVYEPSVREGELRQAEILSNVVEYVPTIDDNGQLSFIPVPYDLAIVMSQDCDLAQDFHERSTHSELDEFSPTVLHSVILCPLYTEDELRSTLPKGSDIYKRVTQNKDERYHFLRAVEPSIESTGVGLPRMGIDFRTHFTIRTGQLYMQLQNSAIRRCRLTSPYLEHLSRRFAAYLSRVGLPLDHHI